MGVSGLVVAGLLFELVKLLAKMGLRGNGDLPSSGNHAALSGDSLKAAKFYHYQTFLAVQDAKLLLEQLRPHYESMGSFACGDECVEDSVEQLYRRLDRHFKSINARFTHFDGTKTAENFCDYANNYDDAVQAMGIVEELSNHFRLEETGLANASAMFHPALETLRIWREQCPVVTGYTPLVMQNVHFNAKLRCKERACHTFLNFHRNASDEMKFGDTVCINTGDGKCWSSDNTCHAWWYRAWEEHVLTKACGPENDFAGKTVRICDTVSFKIPSTDYKFLCHEGASDFDTSYYGRDKSTICMYVLQPVKTKTCAEKESDHFI